MPKSLSHTKWMCKYHLIFTPKFRRKVIYNKYKESIVQILKDLCKWKGVEIIEGKAMVDHIHLLVSIPPKYSVANTVEKLKGKAAIMIHQKYGRQRNFVGLHFWSRGYCVSTVGLDEAMVREYIRTQEEHEKKEEQIQLNY